MSKIQCPKCKIKKSYWDWTWRWALWRDLSGRTFQCPRCKSLFYLKSETHPFLNNHIWYFLFSVIFGGGLGALVAIVFMFLLTVFGGSKVWLLMVIPVALTIGSYFAGKIANKFFILEDMETHRQKE